jgi:hypothetical protein
MDMNTMRLVLPLLLAGFMVSSVQAEEWIMGTALTDEHEVIDNTCSDNFFSNTWKVNKYRRINGNGTLSADGTQCAIKNKKEKAGTRSGYTNYWILVEDRLDAASYSPEMNYPMLEAGVVISESGRAKDLDGNYYTWTDDEIEEEEIVDDLYADSEEEYADDEIEEEIVDDLYTDSEEEYADDEIEEEIEEEELVEPDWSVTNVTLGSVAGMAEIYEWDNDGAHETIRSVKYTDDEIESINHMIAIQTFPWPHAQGFSEAFNKGIAIGACESEWSVKHSSGDEPWGGIPGGEIRGYCAEKATGIDVSGYYH